MKTAAHGTNQRTGGKEMKATRGNIYAQQTVPESSQISHAWVSCSCTRNRQHIKETKTPVSWLKTSTQVHDQERMRIKKEKRNKFGFTLNEQRSNTKSINSTKTSPQTYPHNRTTTSQTYPQFRPS